MREDEWLAAEQFDEAMYSTALKSPVWSFRKETLFSVACCRRVLEVFPDKEGSQLLAEFEIAALAPTGLPAANYARPLSDYVVRAMSDAETTSDQQVLQALGQTARGYIWQVAEACRFAVGNAIGRGELPPSADPEVCRAQASIICDIVGNPFRPVTFSPSWRTNTAVTLARQMYDAREFSAMPILADALQDAGCDNEDILNHCRDTSLTHVRGCWVVDLVLGKE